MILPARDRRDLEEIPPSAREKLQIVWVERADEAIAAALPARDTEVAPASA